MRIIRNSACVLSLMLVAHAVNAESFGLEARSLAMGNARVATADIGTAAFANPAMLAYQRADDDFALLLPSVGLFLDDSDGMVDLIDQYQATSDPNEQVLIAQSLDGRVIQPQLSAALALGMAGETYSFAVSARSDIEMVGSLEDVATNTTEVVDPAFNRLRLFGVQTTEVGVSIARNFEMLGRKLSVGFTPKNVSVNFLAIDESLSTAGTDTSDLIDEDNEVDLGSFSTVDAGVVMEITDNIQIGAMVRNLLSEDLDVNTPAFTGKIKFDTQTRAGIAYRSDFFTLGADLDLTEKDPVTPLGNKTQMASLGAEFNAFDFAQLRAGIQKNIASGISDNAKNELLTAGVGFWFGFHLDVSVISGDDVLGAFVQSGFKF